MKGRQIDVQSPTFSDVGSGSFWKKGPSRFPVLVNTPLFYDTPVARPCDVAYRGSVISLNFMKHCFSAVHAPPLPPLLVDPLLRAYARRGASAVTVRSAVNTRARAIRMCVHMRSRFITRRKGPAEPSIIARSAQSNALGDAH